MKLFDLLEIAQQSECIITNDKYSLGVIYSQKERCYIWCDKDSGEVMGNQKVILSPKLMERNDWSIKILKPVKGEDETKKTKVFLTGNGMVVDSEYMCRIIKSGKYGSFSVIEIDKREGTVNNSFNPLFDI